MEIKVLDLLDVFDLHSERVVFSPDYLETDFDSEWQALRDELRSKLQSKWRESCYGDADFALSDDRTNTWAQAGGIQNKKLLTCDLIRMVFKILKEHPHGDRWGVLLNIHIKFGLLRLKTVSRSEEHTLNSSHRH